jgi:murein DD-endopeptidase MepM/ murein hydrolase activator NlpD
MTYVLPFPESKIPKGGDFGNKEAPRTNAHRGVDFAVAAGTPIKSATDGTVVLDKWSDILGWVVVIQCPRGVTWGYCHLREGSKLNIGDKVVAGETVVGLVGNTGSASRGAHLHFTCGGKEETSVFYGWVQDPVAALKRLAEKTAPKAKAAPAAEAPKVDAPVAEPVAKKAK